MAPSNVPTYPVGAYYLTIFGGLIVAFVGVILFFAGITFTIFIPEVGATILIFSILGVLVGLLLLGCAWMLRRASRSTAAIGVLIVLLAGASLPFTFGGFGIGFLLALVGGILAILWKPSPRGPMFVYTTPAGSSPNLPSLQRVCSACGAFSSPGSTFCTKCGKPFT
ncbi:MAG: zinc ribbon domain-containing protein [Thermoplasmata archaeon]